MRGGGGGGGGRARHSNHLKCINAINTVCRFYIRKLKIKKKWLDKVMNKQVTPGVRARSFSFCKRVFDAQVYFTFSSQC